MNIRGCVGFGLVVLMVLAGCGGEDEGDALATVEEVASAEGDGGEVGTESDDVNNPEESDDGSGLEGDVSDGVDGETTSGESDETDQGAGEQVTEADGNFYQNSEVLMLGDSLLAWFKEDEASVGDVLDDVSSFNVTNAAVSGALFLEGEESIPSQFVEGEWSWVIFDGGGNDANDLCECGDCGEIMDALVRDGAREGEVPEFVKTMTEAGHRVLILGYYGMPETADYGFDRCNDEAALLNQRYADVAASVEGAYFFDLGQVVSPSDLRDYDADHVHPSERGTQNLGVAVADFLNGLALP